MFKLWPFVNYPVQTDCNSVFGSNDVLDMLKIYMKFTDILRTYVNSMFWWRIIACSIETMWTLLLWNNFAHYLGPLCTKQRKVTKLRDMFIVALSVFTIIVSFKSLSADWVQIVHLSSDMFVSFLFRYLIHLTVKPSSNLFKTMNCPCSLDVSQLLGYKDVVNSLSEER